jgi:hypothetical protein
MTDLKLEKLIKEIVSYAKEEGMKIITYKGDEVDKIHFVSLDLQKNEIYFGNKEDFIDQNTKSNTKVIEKRDYFVLEDGSVSEIISYIPEANEIKRLRDFTKCSIKQAISYLTKTKGDMDLAREMIRKTHLK